MNILASFFSRFDVWLIGFGGVLMLRQLFTALAADHGRKQDLVKRLYKPSQDVQLSILVPCLKEEYLEELGDLLGAIVNQEYPAAKVAVHVVTSATTHPVLEGLQMQEALSPNVRLWQYDGAFTADESALAWLIDRCLALGGAGMFVFLKPTDMIKPDFFQNIVAKGFDSFIIQGYVANKSAPVTPFEKVVSLSKRLANRIGNAGRYHLGLSCRLMDSGWAIKQDVLEMIPYHRGLDVDNLEYTLRLNLENFRVTWAPNVVVFSNDLQDFSDKVTLAIGTVVNRFRMFSSYGPRLLTRAVTRFDLTYAENALSIIKPPTILMGAFLVLMGFLAGVMPQTIWPFGSPVSWIALALSLALVQYCGLAVARGKAADYFTMTILMPFVYALGLTLLPIGAVQYISSRIANRQLEEEARENSYQGRRSTRFDETMTSVQHGPTQWAFDPAPNLDDPEDEEGGFAPTQSMVQELLRDKTLQWPNPERGQDMEDDPFNTIMAPLKTRQRRSNSRVAESKEDFWESMKKALPKTIMPFQKGLPKSSYRQAPISMQGMDREAAESQRLEPVLLPREQIKSVLLSNGKNQLDCQLKTLTTYDDLGNERYTLTLEYKSLSFSTATYTILDQAFYELYAKLAGKGLTVVTCGSCGYFYNPTADVPGTLRHSGVCLFGKQGKDVNMSMDAVSVLSQPCDYHAPIEQREALVQQWKNSLEKSRVSSLEAFGLEAPSPAVR